MAPKKGSPSNNPSGRPMLPEGKKRIQRILVTAEERAAIEKKSKAAGFSSVGRFVAKTILGWHSDEK